MFDLGVHFSVRASQRKLWILAFLGYFNDVHAVDTYTHKTENTEKEEEEKRSH